MSMNTNSNNLRSIEIVPRYFRSTNKWNNLIEINE